MIDTNGVVKTIAEIHKELSLIIRDTPESRAKRMTSLQAKVLIILQIIGVKNSPKWLIDLATILDAATRSSPNVVMANLMPIYDTIIKFDAEEFFQTSDSKNFFSIDCLFHKHLNEESFNEAYDGIISCLKEIMTCEEVALTRAQTADVDFLLNSLVQSKSSSCSDIDGALCTTWTFLNASFSQIDGASEGVNLLERIVEYIHKLSEAMLDAKKAVTLEIEGQFYSTPKLSLMISDDKNLNELKIVEYKKLK